MPVVRSAEGSGEARVEFRILGPLEVLDEDRPVALPGGRGERSWRS